MKKICVGMKKRILLLCSLAVMLCSCAICVRAAGYTVSVIDPDRTGSITIYSYATDGGDRKNPIVGQEYRITYQYRLDQSEVEKGDEDFYQTTVQTDGSGYAKFEGLRLGRYLIEQTGGNHTGYKGCESFQVDVPMTNQTEVTHDGIIYAPGTVWEYDITVEPKETLLLGKVILTKYDAETKEVLEGAVFQLFLDSGEPYLLENGDEVRLTTDRMGKIEIQDLPCGSYYLKEMQAPKGYQLSSKKLFFDICLSGQESDGSIMVELEMDNQKKPGGGKGDKPPADPTKTNKVKTGDQLNVSFWILTLISAMFAELYLLHKKKQRSR